MTPADRDALRALLAAKARAQAFFDAIPSRLIGTDESEAACEESVRADHAADVALGNAAPALLDALDAAERERDEERKAYMDLMAERNQIHAERDEARACAEKVPMRSCLACERSGHADTGVSCYGPIGALDCDVTRLNGELREAQAALTALREAMWNAARQPPVFARSTLNAALAATPADLAARVRARHRAEALLEAADAYDNEVCGLHDATWVAEWLRALAAEAERAK